MPHGNLNLHLLIIHKVVRSHICLFYYIPDSLIRIVSKAIEHLKEKTTRKRQMESRKKRQWGIMYDRSCQTNLISVFVDIGSITGKEKRAKS